MKIEDLKHFPIEVVYGFLATSGGVARYLNNYSNGKPFKLGSFIASSFVSGFSGYMFALLGISLNLPQPFIFMMAGTGGFMGEQSLKLIVEYITNKTK